MKWLKKFNENKGIEHISDSDKEIINTVKDICQELTDEGIDFELYFYDENNFELKPSSFYHFKIDQTKLHTIQIWSVNVKQKMTVFLDIIERIKSYLNAEFPGVWESPERTYWDGGRISFSFWRS